MRGWKNFDKSQFRNFAICGVLLLAGCGTAPLVVQRIEVPVYVPCITAAPPKPVYEFDRLPAGATDGEKVLALARDWLAARAYELRLEAALAGCAKAVI